MFSRVSFLAPSHFKSKLLGKEAIRSARKQTAMKYQMLIAVNRFYSNSSHQNQYFPETHPFILKDHNVNMYTRDTKLSLQLNDDVTSENIANHDRHIEPPSFQLLTSSSTLSKARLMLQSEKYDMMKSVFFYHESHPHNGIITNLQFLLFDHYQLVGPVRQSWAKILMKDMELVELLHHHLQAHAGSTETLYVPSLAAIIERIASNKVASMCKYKATVSENTIQFRKSQLSKEELVVLEVLAQYGYYEYEIINW